MWADDTWLKEHAGATLDKDADDEEDDSSSATKRPAEETESVSTVAIYLGGVLMLLKV